MALRLQFLPFSYTSTSTAQSHRNSKTGYVRCMSKQTYTPTSERRSANYQPSTWTFNFLESSKTDKVEDTYIERKNKIKDEVRRVIDDGATDSITLLELVDTIVRLGLGYEFESHITRALERVAPFKESKENPSLHEVALGFRLLRLHGYKVSQDVFTSFLDSKGTFMESLGKDVKGMLSLYEAAHVAYEGENILDMAKTFATKHLRELAEDSDTSLAEHMNHSLEQSLFRRIPKLESRWYIEAHDNKEYAYHKLFELAMWDFNNVQSTLQRDLRDMSNARSFSNFTVADHTLGNEVMVGCLLQLLWWKDIGLANKLTFARDRLMECFFFAAGMASEPQFSHCRNGLTKVTSFITILDDIYDVYGSLDELELFTDAVERWDINALENLPQYMKICFLALYNTVNEMAYDTLKEHGVDIIQYLTKAWADLCKAFLQEAKWLHDKETPTFEEYFENGWLSVSGCVILVHTYFLASPNITKEALDCLEKYHDILRWPSIIFRLCNDLATSPAELERGESANTISLYMNERGENEEGARKHLRGIIDETWKKMIKECNNGGSALPRGFIDMAINLARVCHCIYQYGDGHGAPNSRSKKQILSLIVEPVQLEKQHSF